jgi:D-alanine-D-alanine ligase
MPAELPETLSLALQKAAVVAHRALGCRDLSRTDFIVDQNLRFVVLEVNSLPGMTTTSLYPEGAQGLGLAFDELLIELVERAYRRR